MDAFQTTSPDPEQHAQRRELETLLETAIKTPRDLSHCIHAA
jgi:hypothetical protein